MQRKIPLEPEAAEISNTAAKPPLIFQLPPEEGRAALEKIQDSPVYMCPASVLRTVFQTGEWGEIPVYYITPKDSQSMKSVIFYIHGAGWVFGSFHTHEKLVRELADRTNSLVIFPEYTRSPEARYPTAIEQCYKLLCDIPKQMAVFYPQIDMDTLTVAGDSAGGNMAIAMTLMAKFRKGPRINKQLLYYPVTNACFCTNSYMEFAVDYYLYRAGMMWFWQQYAPSQTMRDKMTASPLRASTEQLSGLPQAMLINGEADVLRDEGESYARKLRMAGVDVTAIRIQAIIHDFVMLNALDQTSACRAAMDVSTDWINRLNCKG